MNKMESEMSEIFSFDSLDSCYKPYFKAAHQSAAATLWRFEIAKF